VRVRRLAIALVLGAATLGAVLFAPVQAHAQSDARQSLVTVTVAPESVTIGEPFTLRIRVRAPKVATIRFPEVPEPAGGVDPVDPRSIEEGPTGDFLDRTALYTFVAWDVGSRGPVLDPVVVTVAGQDRQFSVGTPTVMVRSLLPGDSADQQPRNARGPVRLAGRLWQIIVLGVIALTALIWYLVHRRRKTREIKEQTPPEPWQQAREAFASLEALQLAESGEPGRHVIAHVDVLRSYIERRFPAVDSTLDAPAATAALADLDFPVPVHRVAALLDRDAALRFAHAAVAADEATTLAAEARDITANLQLAHEARLRAIERPPRPRRR
jgi:hypothetical protein